MLWHAGAPHVQAGKSTQSRLPGPDCGRPRARRRSCLPAPACPKKHAPTNTLRLAFAPAAATAALPGLTYAWACTAPAAGCPNLAAPGVAPGGTTKPNLVGAASSPHGQACAYYAGALRPEDHCTPIHWNGSDRLEMHRRQGEAQSA
jgi:hypothetical protein